MSEIKKKNVERMHLFFLLMFMFYLGTFRNEALLKINNPLR